MESIAWGISFFILACTIFWRFGFFLKPPESDTSPITALKCLGIFLFPFLSQYFESWFLGTFPLWIVTYVCVYPRILGKEVFATVWRRRERVNHLLSFCLGVATWLLAFPLVSVVSQSLELLLTKVWDVKLVPQIPVQSLKTHTDNPVAFFAVGFAIAVVFPIVEEVLFRGFLQSWIRRYLPVEAAIVCASFIFMTLHYGPGLGWSNLPILSALFVLACFLGYIYERQRSLWAPIGLHMTVNTISVVVIYMT